jgi:hypothetical protein
MDDYFTNDTESSNNSRSEKEVFVEDTQSQIPPQSQSNQNDYIERIVCSTPTLKDRVDYLKGFVDSNTLRPSQIQRVCFR